MQHLWTKRWKGALWILLTTGSLVLLITAFKKKDSEKCEDISIEITGPNDHFFVAKREVLEIINEGENVKGQAIQTINLRLLEARLEQDSWIQNAELFFDNNQVLQVKIEEKEPVARLFTVGGNSFYIDSACNRLPLSDKLSARVPMFTNFPSNGRRLARPDSQLLASVKELALFIQHDKFWNAQIAQVDITPQGFEMIPTIGNHVVVLGRDDYQQKFDRLFSFYKQVWPKVGLEAYEKIDVQFKGQVITTKKGAGGLRIDSAGVRQAIQTLLADSKKQVEQASMQDDKQSAPKATTTTVIANDKLDVKKAEPKKEEVKKVETKDKAGEAKNSALTTKEESKKGDKQTEEKKVPKAVMQKKAG